MVKDYRKDPDGKTPRMVVFMSNVWLCYVARTQVFVASAHTLIDSLLEDPLFLEGTHTLLFDNCLTHLMCPSRRLLRSCAHDRWGVVRAVDTTRDIHMSPDSF